jgi:hypothetical protein
MTYASLGDSAEEEVKRGWLGSALAEKVSLAMVKSFIIGCKVSMSRVGGKDSA